MIIFPHKVKLPAGKRLIIIPIGDVQGEEQLDRLDELIQWCVGQKKEGHLVRLFLTGDYFETFSPSERRKIAAADLHETSLDDIQATARAKADDFVRRLSPLRGDILTALQGHHWQNIPVNKVLMSSDNYIAEKLGAEYCGNGSLVIDMLVNGLSFRIFTTHGYGSGRMAGGRVNKRLQMRNVILNANWYAMGHDNEKFGVPQEPLYVDSGELKYLKQYFTGIGCFQESYHLGRLDAGYAEKVLYPPSAIGVVMGTVTVAERHGNKRLDYHVST